VAVSGVRADESEDRSKYLEWDFSGQLLTLQWRPLIRWKYQNVLDIHKKYNIPMNPLYALGAERVGCYPCINSRKKEIRTIALNFPERIQRIENLEEELWKSGKTPSFFHSSMIPERFRTRPFTSKDGEHMMVAKISDVVKWSMTGKRAKGSYEDDPPEPISCSSGFCE
jgi:3'-phosphoadenosine 5'-phosphosulfate sulfotransferase (PAPS reductase)/FAD synthetase